MHTADMVIDLQFGSTGKGLLAGWLAKRKSYDTVVCSFATNAGHTYIDQQRKLHVMTQQLPTGITSRTVKNVLLGPGSLIHLPTLFAEMDRYKEFLRGKQIIVHPQAAIVHEGHMQAEQLGGMSRIGSTTKGVGAAMIQRILRNPDDMNVAGRFGHGVLNDRGIIVSAGEFRHVLDHSEAILIEGAQGFSLSMYHGFYPYTTSRDVTPWQIAADCGLPFKWASYIRVCGTLRTFPIRVNNRDGSSGPGYPDQIETSFEALGLEPELTTVTKLPRRIFTFSHEQLQQAHFHCGGYWDTRLFLNFANYMDPVNLRQLIQAIETAREGYFNPPKVEWIGYGPDDCNVMERAMYDNPGLTGEN